MVQCAASNRSTQVGDSLKSRTNGPSPADRPQWHDTVIHIAVDLFAERGYDNVTVDEIASVAGVSRRSLFRHFRQKEEFLNRWMQRFNDQLCASIVRQAQQADPLLIFRQALNDVDEIGSAAASRLLVLNRITSQSTNASAAMISAQRSWENAVVAAFKSRASDHESEQEVFAWTAAALGFLGLRLAMEEWTTLPASAADQKRLAEILDATFAAIRKAPR